MKVWNRGRMKEWSYEEPKFECDVINGDLLIYAPWSGHRNFIYDFIIYYKPQKIVELGSHYGCSSFAMLQAIKDGDLATEFNAVDTWKGDAFTVYDGKENVYEAYKEINDKCFGEQNSNMLRMTFDEAVDKFENYSIDVLHIDGSHHYKDVKHDYQTWKNKVKHDGIILFHDISEDKMFGKVMGSHDFWEELKQGQPYTCEFDFSFGLGILFFSKECFEDFKEKVDMEKYQRINNGLSVNYKDTIRKKHFELNDMKKWLESLKKDKAFLEKDNQRLVAEAGIMKKNYEESIVEIKREYGAEIDRVKEEYERGIAKMKKEYGQEINEIKKEYENTITKKEQYISELSHTISIWKQEVEKVKQDYEHTINGKDAYIKELEQKILSKGQ